MADETQIAETSAVPVSLPAQTEAPPAVPAPGGAAEPVAAPLEQPSSAPAHAPQIAEPDHATLLMEFGETLVVVGTAIRDPAAPETAREWVVRHRWWFIVIAILFGFCLLT